MQPCSHMPLAKFYWIFPLLGCFIRFWSSTLLHTCLQGDVVKSGPSYAEFREERPDQMTCGPDLLAPGDYQPDPRCFDFASISVLLQPLLTRRGNTTTCSTRQEYGLPAVKFSTASLAGNAVFEPAKCKQEQLAS